MSNDTKVVIDRIEGELAVLDHQGIRAEIPLSMLPKGATEGSVLCICLSMSDQSSLIADAEERLQRLESSSEFSQNDDGSFDL